MSTPATARRALVVRGARYARSALALALALAVAQPASALGLAFDARRPARDDAAYAAAASGRALASTKLPGPGVVDYASGFSAATTARLKAAGVGIVIRYVAASSWKSMKKSEASALRAAGLDVAAVYETDAKWMLGGRSAGVTAAKRARAAVIACGGPSTPFIWFACDTPTANYTTVNACLAGAASVLGVSHVGIYGSYDVCDAALKSGWASKAWQTEAWSNGKILATSAIYQRAHAIDGNLHMDYDSNLARAEDVGQWGFIAPSLGWTSQSAPTTATLRGIDFVSASSGWAVGDGGTVLHSADGGSGWIAQPAPTGANLRAVNFASASEGWAVGDGGTVLHTGDAGTSWAPQSTPTSATLRGVDFASSDDGWAVGDSGAILHTIDAGASWTPQASPTTATLTAVHFANATSGWAVGELGTILHTTDAGTTWTQQVAATPATLTASDFESANNAWAVGTDGTFARTTSAGATWTVSSLGTTAAIDAVRFTDAKTGCALGEGGTILRTTDGGASWTRLSAPTTATLLATDFFDARTGWAVGEGGTILRAHAINLSPYGTIVGTVTDSATGLPLAGISVKVNSRLAAPTCPDGSLSAARLAPGTYSVTLSDPRYITQTLTGVTVTAAARTSIKVALKLKARVSLSAPSLTSAATPVAALPVSIATTISPVAAAGAAAVTLTGWHYEAKTVTKNVKKKKVKVKVWSWRARFSAKLVSAGGGRLTFSRRLAAGQWRVRASYPGAAAYLSAGSATVGFTVR